METNVQHTPVWSRSGDFGLPQLRTRLYFVMVREDVGTVQTVEQIFGMAYFCQQSLAEKPRATVWDVEDYVKACKIDDGSALLSRPPDPKVATSKVGGKARRLYDDMKKKHGLDTLSPEEYRVFSSGCIAKYGISWCDGLTAREIEGLDLMYHMTPEEKRDMLVIDIVKSLDMKIFRCDGFSPTLVTNAKIFDMRNGRLLSPAEMLAMHGFDV